MADKPETPSNKKNPLDLPLIKGFVAGVIFSHLNKRLIGGIIIGTVSGIYIQQNYVNIPNVESTIKEWVEKTRQALEKKTR
jgi:hypothetical protein